MDRRADILAVLEKEGPLGVEAISQKGKVPLGTVRAYIPTMIWAGFVRRYRNAKGIFEITEKGREYLKKGGLSK